jgi:nicotinamidase-related amidase
MTLTPLDTRVALILVDLQNALQYFPLIHPLAEVVRRAADVASAFRAAGQPVVLVNVEGGAPGRASQPLDMHGLPEGWTNIVPELAANPLDIRVTKKTWGAFGSTSLSQLLAERGCTQVVIGGAATSIGVESTARQAHELGLNVTILTDVLTDISVEAHHNSITNIFPKLAEISTAEEIIAAVGAQHEQD